MTIFLCVYIHKGKGAFCDHQICARKEEKVKKNNNKIFSDSGLLKRQNHGTQEKKF